MKSRTAALALAGLFLVSGLAWAADNFRQPTSGGTVTTFRSTDTAGVHVPHVNVDRTSGTATYVDRSGTITSGGAAQTIAAANASRRGFFIQNQSTGDMWLRDAATAAGVQPSILLPSGAYYQFPDSGAPTTLLSLFGATTGQAFAAREW